MPTNPPSTPTLTFSVSGAGWPTAPDTRTASGAIASSEASDEATGDVLSYSSLYSPEPPAAKNGKVNGKVNGKKNGRPRLLRARKH